MKTQSKEVVASKRKVFLLGIDSTSLSYIRNNVSALPNLNRIIDNGRVIETESPSNLMTASVWPTLVSGTMPGQHGSYFPLQWDPSSMKFRESGDIVTFQPFWDELGAAGIKIIAFDVTAFSVSKSAPGVQIFNWNSQDNHPAISNKSDVLKKITKLFGRRPIGIEVRAKKSRRVLTDLTDRLINSIKIKTDAIIWLMREFDWQFFITAYYEGHRAGHNLWPIWEDFSSDPPEGAMLDVYQELDKQIGRLVSKLNLSETALILFSLHGMAPGFAQDHFLPTILNRVNSLYLNMTKPGHKRVERQGVAHFLRQTLPPSFQHLIRQLVGQKVQDWFIDLEFRGGKDWQSTPAFPVPGGGETGFIRLNIAGRERNGFLPPLDEGGSKYVDFLCRQLRAIRVKETNEPLIRDLVMTKDEFPGPCSYLLPDILLTWRPERPVTEIWSKELGTIRARLSTGRGGHHTGESFAVLAGAIGQPDKLPRLRHVVDYKALVNGLLGVSGGGASQ